MVGWYHRLHGHEFEQAPGVSEGQGGLVCCGPRGHRESDTTERLNVTTSTVWSHPLPQEAEPSDWVPALHVHASVPLPWAKSPISRMKWMQSLPPASSLAREKDLRPHLRFVCTLRESSQDFSGSPVVKTLPSKVGAVGSTPGQGAKTPQSSWPKIQNTTQKQYRNKFSKDFKNGPHQKKKKLKNK